MTVIPEDDLPYEDDQGEILESGPHTVTLYTQGEVTLKDGSVARLDDHNWNWAVTTDGDPATVDIAGEVHLEEGPEPVGFEQPGFAENQAEDDLGEAIVPDTRRAFASILFGSKEDLLAKLGGSYGAGQPNLPRIIENPCLLWQIDDPLWIVDHYRRDHEQEQFNSRQLEIEAREIKDAKTRQMELARLYDASEVEVSSKDKATFTKEFSAHRDFFYRELLKLSAIDLGLDSATDKVEQVLQMLLDDQNLRVEFNRSKTAMRDLVDLKFISLMAKTLQLDLDSDEDRAQLHGLLAVLRLQGPEEKPHLPMQLLQRPKG